MFPSLAGPENEIVDMCIRIKTNFSRSILLTLWVANPNFTDSVLN